MKKKLVAGAIIIFFIIAMSTYLSQPKAIINDTNNYDIYRVVYNDVDVTERVDCKALASIVGKYKCSRVPHIFAPYQQSQVVVELNGVNGNNPLHIILGDINVAYESGNKGGFSIKNSAALLNEILITMPYQTEEELGLQGKLHGTL